MEENDEVRIGINAQELTVPSDISVLMACMSADPEAAPDVICGMGSCYACVVTRNGSERLRSCITPVRNGDSYEF